MTFTLQLSAIQADDVTVNYATRDGSATAGVDYVAASGTATINAGNTSVGIDTTVNGDTDVESDETLYLDITNPRFA